MEQQQKRKMQLKENHMPTIILQSKTSDTLD